MVNVCVCVCVCVCVNRVLAVLAAPTLAILIADSGNKNKTCDYKAFWLFLLQNAIEDIFTRYRNKNDGVYNWILR